MTAVFIVGFGLFTEHRLKPWRTAFTSMVRFADKLADRATVAVRGG
jgi:hypothetical protein